MVHALLSENQKLGKKEIKHNYNGVYQNLHPKLVRLEATNVDKKPH